jgi:LysM repeat protein
MYDDIITSSVQLNSIPGDSTNNLPGDLTPEQAAQGEKWKVEAGDTLSSIATQMGVSLKSLLLHNKITSRTIIKAGQFIYKPPPASDAEANNQDAPKPVPVTDDMSASAKYIWNMRDNIIPSILTAEGGDGIEDGVLHRGSEIDKLLNPDLKQTTRYGVVLPHTHKKRKKDGKIVDITVAGFKKNKGETDKEHAERYYKERVLPKLKALKGVEKEPVAVMSALSKYIWNKGSLPSSFDLNNEASSQEGMLDITTSDKGQMNGIVNRTLSEYDAIAAQKGWARITKIRTVVDPKNANRFKVQYHNAAGLVHDDGEYKAINKDAHKSYVAGKEFDVVDNIINIANGRDIPKT